MSEERSARKETYKVVVVEDEERILENIARKIEQVAPAFEVVGKARTGREALALVDDLLPDVVFTDIRMPVMGGLELIETLQTRYPYIKTVIVSGYADFEYAQRAISFGVSGYLLKPVEIEHLRRVLDKLRIALDAERRILRERFAMSLEARDPEDVVRVLQQFMKEHYVEDINLNFLAEQFGYSASYLSKLFAKHVGVSPGRYLIELRMNRAKYLLKNCRDLSVKQIAEAVGYPDPCYFSRMFKKFTGKSPQEFRETVS
ncbi:MAG: helix-turn-helix domain-containing protein [candidate division WOR-3 bacterium]